MKFKKYEIPHHNVNVGLKISYKAKEYFKHKSFTSLIAGGTFPVPPIVNPLINKIRYPSTSVEPGKGSPIYCDLGFGFVEHSGIYIGNFEAIQLNGRGLVEVVNLFDFTDNISTTSRDVFFPLDKVNSIPIEFDEAYDNALRKRGKLIKYNVVLNNCHKFTSGCLTGDFNQNNQLLDFMKCTTEQVYGKKIIWRRWDWISQIGE